MVSLGDGEAEEARMLLQPFPPNHGSAARHGRFGKKKSGPCATLSPRRETQLSQSLLLPLLPISRCYPAPRRALTVMRPTAWLRIRATAPAAAIPPIRLAIIGSGPSAFYSAARLLSSPTLKSEDPASLTVHMFERLPIPNGLVRWGVAPDHLDVKNVEHKFAEVAKDPRFRFCGNVNVVQGTEDGSEDEQGRTGYQYPHAIQLSLATLARHYTHILFSYGCSSSRPLGIPGSQPSELTNVHSALDFVNWYNGHPAAHDEELLRREPWRRVDLAGGKSQMDVIGAGNVALDVARIVLRASAGSLLAPSASSPSSSGRRAKEALETSDVPESVLQHLSESRINHVDISARRGPAQAAFTNKELREMLALPDVGFEPVDSELLQKAEAQVAQQEEESRRAAQAGDVDADAAGHSAGEARVRKRLLSLLAKGSKTSSKEADRNWRLNFYRAPAAFLGGSSSSGGESEPLKAIQWTSTSYPLRPVAESAAAKATSGPAAPWGNEPAPTSSEGVATLPTDSTSSAADSTPRVLGSAFETKSDLVVSSVGYRGTPLTGSHGNASDTSSGQSSSLLPWDSKRGVVPNLEGRVVSEAGEVLPNIYVSGWLARGPVGVIASTMHDAYSVADTILADHLASSSSSSSSADRPPVAALNALLLSSPALGSRRTEELVPSLPRDLLHPQGNKRLVSWSDWLRLDQIELERGKRAGKAREKTLDVREMLELMG